MALCSRQPLASLTLMALAAALAGCGGGSDSGTGDPHSQPATGRQWTWIGGSNVVNGQPTYGTQGSGSTHNIPGARAKAISWTDPTGNFWLFGGEGADAVGSTAPLNDLWEFNPGTNAWTWVSGSELSGAAGSYGTEGTASTTTQPGARTSAVSWVDAAGNLWLFGGEGLDALGTGSLLNDLWKYDPGNNTWTWVSGSPLGGAAGSYGSEGTPATTNTPGARQAAVAWIDSSGNFWLFGGYGVDSQGLSNWLNDLWEYVPSNHTWVWISGSNVRGAAGVYGTLGVAADGNVPGSRDLAVSCIDSSGDLWLFGGYGVDSANTSGKLNDLWKFNLAARAWTWISGSSVMNAAPVYGTQGTASPANVPGARQEATSWADSAGNLWLFGGVGNGTAGSGGDLNDLWKFDPSTLTWTWLTGSTTVYAKAVYGTRGTPAPANTPGARQDAVSWVDSSGNLWLFGGYGVDLSNSGNLNDLWMYTP